MAACMSGAEVGDVRAKAPTGWKLAIAVVVLALASGWTVSWAIWVVFS